MNFVSRPGGDESGDTVDQAEARAQADRDAELIELRLAIAGDAAAFAELYDREVVRVYRHLYYLVNDRSAAEDLTAQTFLQAWEAIHRYEERGVPFLGWLLRIAHNIGVSYLRAKRDHSELVDTKFDEKVDSNPEDALQLVEDGKDVRQAIMKLPEEQRHVILLRFVEEMDYVQVAAIIGKSVPAARVIQHRALERLRKIMQAAA